MAWRRPSGHCCQLSKLTIRDVTRARPRGKIGDAAQRRAWNDGIHVRDELQGHLSIFFFFFSLFLFDLIRRFRLFAHYGRLYMHESLLPREHRPWHCLADKPSSGLGDMKSHVNTAHMKAPPSNLNCSIGWNTGNYSQPYPSASI